MFSPGLTQVLDWGKQFPRQQGSAFQGWTILFASRIQPVVPIFDPTSNFFLGEATQVFNWFLLCRHCVSIKAAFLNGLLMIMIKLVRFPYLRQPQYRRLRRPWLGNKLFVIGC